MFDWLFGPTDPKESWMYNDKDHGYRVTPGGQVEVNVQLLLERIAELRKKLKLK